MSPLCHAGYLASVILAYLRSLNPTPEKTPEIRNNDIHILAEPCNSRDQTQDTWPPYVLFVLVSPLPEHPTLLDNIKITQWP